MEHIIFNNKTKIKDFNSSTHKDESCSSLDQEDFTIPKSQALLRSVQKSMLVQIVNSSITHSIGNRYAHIDSVDELSEISAQNKLKFKQLKKEVRGFFKETTQFQAKGMQEYNLNLLKAEFRLRARDLE